MLAAVRPWVLVAIVVLNAVLAGAMQHLAPSQPLRTDRKEYEYTGEHPLQPNCRNTIYCYRLVVPVMLHNIPGPWEQKWRAYQVIANAAAGATLAVAAFEVLPLTIIPVLSTLIVQSSYGFTFTAYDPYTADPMVFLWSALLLLCWVRNRASAAVLLALIGVFIKETVGLVALSFVIAALLDRHRPLRWIWVLQGAAAAAVLLAFHYVMDTYYGWNTMASTAADFSKGSWIAIWWRSNPSLMHKLLMLFSPFGFAWIFAVVGFFRAARELRLLAIGVILPMLALVYVQTPERALANAFFIVIPLAIARLYQSPVLVALLAATANGLVTAKQGLSTPSLPSTAGLLIPAAVSAAFVFWFTKPGYVEPEPEDRVHTA
jgi:hypothetical protein